MVLRILKNSLQNSILKPQDLDARTIINDLLPLINYRSRIQIIAKILSYLSSQNEFREQLATYGKRLIEVLLREITTNQLIISDDCLENCLCALTQMSKDNKEISEFVSDFTHFQQVLVGFIRHPNQIIRIHASQLICNLNKHLDLPREITL